MTKLKFCPRGREQKQCDKTYGEGQCHEVSIDFYHIRVIWSNETSC